MKPKKKYKLKVYGTSRKLLKEYICDTLKEARLQKKCIAWLRPSMTFDIVPYDDQIPLPIDSIPPKED